MVALRPAGTKVPMPTQLTQARTSRAAGVNLRLDGPSGLIFPLSNVGKSNIACRFQVEVVKLLNGKLIEELAQYSTVEQKTS